MSENKYRQNFTTSVDPELRQKVIRLSQIHNFEISKKIDKLFEKLISKYENKEIENV